MATGYVPVEFSPIVEKRRPQKTPTYPDLPDIVVTYDRSKRGTFASQLKSSIYLLFIINMGVSLAFLVANAGIEAIRIKSQTGNTHTIALVNGGRY